MKQTLKYNYQPIILIGAGRSGTKIIRDVIGQHPDIAVVPFDVNYIWTIGQSAADDDALKAVSLKEQEQGIILNQFNKIAKEAPFLLEKTVSNCLRIPYVLKVFPNAIFLHLVRDGRDVVESVARQWGETREVSYFIKKIKTFPLRYSFSYLMDYISNWIKHKTSGQGKDDYIWGVRYPGYKDDLSQLSKLEVCAKQWKICVETSEEQLRQLDQSRILKIRYEELVTEPEKQFKAIGQHLDLDSKHFGISKLSTQNIGKHIKAFSPEQLKSVLSIIGPTLNKLNYS